MLTRPFTFLRGAFAVGLLASTFAACGGGGAATQPVVPSAGSGETPVAATNTFCVTPSATQQNATIPSTGGFTGTLAIAATATSGACNFTVTVTTGADVATGAAAATSRHAEATNQTTTPILQISFDNAFTNNVAVNGATLNTPSNLNFPDGTYSAVVTSGSLPSTGLVFVAKNGVLTLQLNGSPIVIVPGTTATLSLYARGVTPVETPAPTATPSSSASATPSPVPSATAMPTVTPLPSPTASAAITATVTLSPAGCIAYGNSGAMPVYTAIVNSNAPAGTVFKYGWQGTSDFPVTPNAPYTQITDPATDSYVLLSSSTTATVQIGTYPQGSLAGAGGSIGVYLFTVDPTYGQVNPVSSTGNASMQASARAQIEAGSQTC